MHVLFTRTVGKGFAVSTGNKNIREKSHQCHEMGDGFSKEKQFMMKREAFLQVVSKESIEDFLSYTRNPKNTVDHFDLNELLQELPRKQKEVLWERLTQLLTESLRENPVETCPRTGDEKSDDHMVVEITPQIGADIVRLWNLHQGLLCFDYDSEESNEIKDLLLQCFMSVKHIKKEEGRRFLSFLFSWNINFIRMIHGTVKNQLQFFPRSLMEYISEIYFRAWKKMSGEFIEVLEHDCIQDFVYHGIHLPRSSSFHSKVREMLSYFHKQSRVRQGVEEMLYRLYQPILWRALKVRNSEVRANAAFLFVNAFPLRDPNFNAEEMDSEIQRQFEELFRLLDDPHPVVRSTGILGVTQITSRYWEMIPSVIVADLLKKITGELAYDVSSADVRCSVFKCLPIILDNNLSHPLLEHLLPVTKYSLRDSSEKVRVAFVDMLLKVKATKAAKFWNICPMEDILARLEVDSRPVSRRIVNLLFNSFFPVNQPEDVWCERCVTLIQMNPAAARKFYQYAYEYTSPTNIAKLMLTIRRCLNACIQKASKCDSGEDDDDESEKENTSVLENVLSLNDVASMASLLEVIVILWRSIYKALDHNEEVKDYAIRKFASVLPEYFKVFKDERCMAPLVILASFMPIAAVPTFSCGVISRLRNIDCGADQSKYSTLIDCMCRWGQVGHIMELACDWLSDALTPRLNVKRSGRRVRINVTQESKPDLAVDYIDYLLTHPVNRDCLLSVPKKKLKKLLKILSAAKFCEEGDCLSLLKETGAWIEDQVVPFILSSDQEDGISKHSNVSELIIQAYLTVCKDVIMVGLGNLTFQAHVLDLALPVIQTERGGFCAPVLLCALKEIVEASLTQNTETDEVASLFHTVQNILQKVLTCVTHRLKKKQEEGIQASSEEDVTIPKTISDLPPLSSSLMAIIMKSVNVVRSFLNELMEGILSEKIKGIFSLTATVSIVMIIKGKHKAALLKDIAPALRGKLVTCSEATAGSSGTERMRGNGLKLCQEIGY
ncbi:Condensin-2 complex subunit G2 [Pitangus sulphuratus]|nr:Condensin-2 complex subunit G2 [Pitangus sulphuratus]